MDIPIDISSFMAGNAIAMLSKDSTQNEFKVIHAHSRRVTIGDNRLNSNMEMFSFRATVLCLVTLGANLFMEILMYFLGFDGFTLFSSGQVCCSHRLQYSGLDPSALRNNSRHQVCATSNQHLCRAHQIIGFPGHNYLKLISTSKELISLQKARNIVHGAWSLF